MTGALRDGLARVMAGAMGWEWQTEPGVPSPAEAMHDAADAALAYLAQQDNVVYRDDDVVLLAHRPAQRRPDVAESVRAAVGSVLWNVSNYPERVQARMLGQDSGPLRDKVTDAVVAALPTRSDAAPALNDVQRMMLRHYRACLSNGETRFGPGVVEPLLDLIDHLAERSVRSAR